MDRWLPTWTGVVLLLGLGSGGCAWPEPGADPAALPAALPGPEPSPGAAVDDLGARLVPLFSGCEYVPSRADLERIAPAEALVPALIALVDAEERPLQQRIHALEALRHFPTATSRGTLEAVLLAADSPRVARRVAVKAYGAAFGVAATPVLGHLLDHADPHTREAVVRALGRIGSPAAVDMVRNRLRDEPEGWVRETAQRALEAAAAGR